jgi:acetylornithine deacetylase/succinyl-diaminopimelate desuccinylase-like protein
MAKIDMRLVKNQTPPEILKKFKAHAQKHGFSDIEIIPLMQYYPSKTPLDHPASRTVVSAIQGAFGQEPLIYPVTGGSNPSYIFHDLCGIPMVKVSYANYDESNHAPNENLSLDFFSKGIQATARFIQDFSNF